MEEFELDPATRAENGKVQLMSQNHTMKGFLLVGSEQRKIVLRRWRLMFTYRCWGEVKHELFGKGRLEDWYTIAKGVARFSGPI